MLSKVILFVCVAIAAGRPERPASASYGLPQLQQQSYQAPQQQSYQAPQQQQTYQAPQQQSYQAPQQQSYQAPQQRGFSQSQSRSQNSYSQPQQSYGSEQKEEGMPFEFAYAVKDEYSGNDYSHASNSDGHVTKGEYRVLLPDGRTQIVTYVADHDQGYQAEVTYEGEARPYEPQQNSNQGYQSQDGFQQSQQQGYQAPSQQSYQAPQQQSYQAPQQQSYQAPQQQSYQAPQQQSYQASQQQSYQAPQQPQQNYGSPSNSYGTPF